MDFKEATDLLAVPLEKVAEVVGKSYQTVAAYRIGRREVPPEVWAKLAAFMREHGGKLAEAANELESKG